jgi:hypothetical protein
MASQGSTQLPPPTQRRTFALAVHVAGRTQQRRTVATLQLPIPAVFVNELHNDPPGHATRSVHVVVFVGGAHGPVVDCTLTPCDSATDGLRYERPSQPHAAASSPDSFGRSLQTPLPQPGASQYSVGPH